MSKPFGDIGGGSANGGDRPATGGSSILGKLLGEQGTTGGKQKVPAYVSNDLLERLRDTVVGMQRDPNVSTPPVSLSSFVEAAIEAAVEAAEEEHNGGLRYPPRPNQRLKTGPPVG